MTNQDHDIGANWTASFDEHANLWIRRPRGDVFLPRHAVPSLCDVLAHWTPDEIGVPPVVADGLRNMLGVSPA